MFVWQSTTSFTVVYTGNQDLASPGSHYGDTLTGRGLFPGKLTLPRDRVAHVAVDLHALSQ